MTWDSDCGASDRSGERPGRGDIDGPRADPEMEMRHGATPIHRQRVRGRFGAVTRRVASLARRDGYTRSPRAPARRTTAVRPVVRVVCRIVRRGTAHTATAHIPKTIHTNKGQTRSALAGPGGRGDETRRAAAHRTTHVPHWQRRLQGRSQRARARRDTLTRIHAGYTCATVGWLARLPLSSLTDVTQISPPLPSCATIAPE